MLGGSGLVACSDDMPASEGLSGTVTVDGSSTVTPLLRAVADELVAEVEPGITVELTTSGTSAGLRRLCDGRADVAMASREITAEELTACAEAGVEAVEVPVGLDAVSVVVPARNDYVDCLGTEELARVFGAAETTTSPVTTWQDLRPGWPGTVLVLFGPGAGSGTADSFSQVVLDGGPQRGGLATSEDDSVLVQGVAASPGGLGYVPMGYALDAADAVRAVPVDAGDGCVGPTPETAADGTYPLTRPVMVYVSARSYADDAAVAALVDHLVRRGADLAEDAGVVPPSADQQAEAQAALDALGSDGG